MRKILAKPAMRLNHLLCHRWFAGPPPSISDSDEKSIDEWPYPEKMPDQWHFSDALLPDLSDMTFSCDASYLRISTCHCRQEE